MAPLLADPSVSDVVVNGPGKVWVDQGAGLRRVPVRFPDEAAVRSPGVMGGLVGADAGLSAVHMHAVLAPIAIDGTCLSLRVLRPATQGLDTLASSGAIAPRALRILRAVVAARLSFLVVGGTGAGYVWYIQHVSLDLYRTADRWGSYAEAALADQQTPVQRILRGHQEIRPAT